MEESKESEESEVPSKRMLIRHESLPGPQAFLDATLSRNAGFISTSSLCLSLPAKFQCWDDIAKKIPEYIETGRIVSILNGMPTLTADIDSLPNDCLTRASVILSAFAHAYKFHLRKFLPESEVIKHPLPESIEIPWQEICQRLGRDSTRRTSAEDYYNNLKLKNPNQPATFNNIDLMVPYTNSTSERNMNRTIIAMEMAFGPALGWIVEAQQAAIEGNLPKVKQTLYNLILIMRQVIKEFHHIRLEEHSKEFMDPTMWGRTFMILGKSTRHEEPRDRGSDISLFHVLDAFINRKHYDSQAGKEMQESLSGLHVLHKNFVDAVKLFSVGDYVDLTQDPQLTSLYKQFIYTYCGEHGLLNIHRRKILAFIELAMNDNVAIPSNEDSQKLTPSFSSARLSPSRISSMINAKLKSGIDDRMRSYDNTWHTVYKINQHQVIGTRITFDISHQHFVITPGDCIEVLAENSDERVELLLKTLSIDRKAIGPIFKILKQVDIFNPVPGIKSILKKYFNLHITRDIKFTTVAGILEQQDRKRKNTFFKALLKPQSEIYWEKLFRKHHSRLYSIALHSDSSLEILVGNTTGNQNSVNYRFTSLQLIDAPIKTEFRVRIHHNPRFSIEAIANRPVVMFAGGSAISSFINYLNSYPHAHGSFLNTLFYGVRSMPCDYLDELISFAQKKTLNLFIACSSSKTLYYFDYDEGVLKDQKIDSGHCHVNKFFENSEIALKKLIECKGKIYCCGSTQFSESIKHLLRNHSVSTEFYKELIVDHFHVESFNSDGPTHSLKPISMSKLLKHNTAQKGYWIMINRRIYDVTRYIDEHPGGAKILIHFSGLDCTDLYTAVHANQQQVSGLLRNYEIGFSTPAPKMIDKRIEEIYRLANGLATYLTQQQNIFRNGTTLPRGTSLLYQFNPIKNFLSFTIPNLVEQIEKLIGEKIVLNNNLQKMLSEQFLNSALQSILYEINDSHSLHKIEFLNNARSYIKDEAERIMMQIKHIALVLLKEIEKGIKVQDLESRILKIRPVVKSLFNQLLNINTSTLSQAHLLRLTYH